MDEYNALLHFAQFRSNVVSDIPDDIDLSDFDLIYDEKALIKTGIPLVRDCILSVYYDIVEYARENFLTPSILSAMQKKGGIMTVNRKAQAYLNTVFLSLLSIMNDCEYDGNATITASKEYLKNFKWQLREKLSFNHSLLKHFECFCRIEYFNFNNVSDWKKCDKVLFIFDDIPLCFTLRHMAQNGVKQLYFQYGDFRMYSKTGRLENFEIFPESVRLKALGNERYAFYCKLKKLINEQFNAVPTSENPYQGYGEFQIIIDFYNDYLNTQIALNIKENLLLAEFHFDFLTFEKLPEIMELLTPNIKYGILNTQQCCECPFNCQTRRKAEFDEDIFPKKVLIPCKCVSTACVIEDLDDIESIKLLYLHIKKYTLKHKGSVKRKK